MFLFYFFSPERPLRMNLQDFKPAWMIGGWFTLIVLYSGVYKLEAK